MSSDESSLPASKQNARRKRRTRNSGNKRKRYRHRKFRKRFASSPTCTLCCGNHPSTPLHLPRSKQSALIARPFREQSDGHENLPSTFPAKSSKFLMSSKPFLHTPLAFSDPTSHYVKLKGCSEKRLYCSPVRTSKPAASSSTNRLILDCIRNSEIPLNINRSFASSITTSRGRSYFRPLSFHTTHSTPKYYPALEESGRIGTITQNISQISQYPRPTFSISPFETANQMTILPCSTPLHNILKDPSILKERGISPCSTMVEVGSMESILGCTTSSSSKETNQNSSEPIYFVPPNSRAEVRGISPCSTRVEVGSTESILRCTTSLSRENSQNSSSPICVAPPNSVASQISSKKSSDSNDGTENIKSFVNLDSGCPTFKRNSTYSKSVPEKNGQKNTPLKNEISSKTFKRQCPSQLQIYASPSNTSTSALRESKYIENATGSINRPAPYSYTLYNLPEVRPPGDSKAANVLLAEKDRSYPMSLYSEKHVGKFLETLNPIQSLPSSNERHNVENAVESVRQSFTSLSMMYGLPTEASGRAAPSIEPNSKQNAHSRNKTRKKSKLISCFTTCFRSSSPQQKGQI